MSRLARKAIQIPNGITASLNNDCLEIVKSGQVTQYSIPEAISVSIEDGAVLCTTVAKDKAAASLLGTTHVNISNIFTGLITGFTIELQLVGIGYGVVVEGKELVLTLGKSHIDRYTVSDDVKITIPDKNTIVIFGQSKHRVGDVADEIVRFRPPDAYKGKGIRYKHRQYTFKEVKK